jgi:D-threo-aldose 1-dehydrogenase
MYNYAPAGPEILERVRRIEAVCACHHVPLPAAALHFPLGHPIVASIIPGAIFRAQVKQTVSAFRHPIPPGLWAELKHDKLIRSDAPTPA